MSDANFGKQQNTPHIFIRYAETRAFTTLHCTTIPKRDLPTLEYYTSRTDTPPQLPTLEYYTLHTVTPPADTYFSALHLPYGYLLLQHTLAGLLIPTLAHYTLCMDTYSYNTLQ